jgi:hypothetical protein
MNDAKLTIKSIEDIVMSAALKLTLSDRCALRAGLETFIQDIEKLYVRAFGEVDPYMSEKLFKVRWHVNANLGFDVTNGHDEQQHRVMALGNLQTAENVLQMKFPDLF